MPKPMQKNMPKHMKKQWRQTHYMLFAVAAVAIAYIAAAPGAAQAQDEAASTTPADPAMDDGQKAEHDSWSAEKQAAYAAWPAETKTYYWSLSDSRQMMFWALADTDKIALTAMTGPEREAAWERIEARAGPRPSAGWPRAS